MIDADHDRLVVRGDVHLHEAVVEHADQHSADQRADHATLAAEEARAADHDRRDRLQLVVLPGDLLGRVEAGREQEAETPAQKPLIT